MAPSPGGWPRLGAYLTCNRASLFLRPIGRGELHLQLLLLDVARAAARGRVLLSGVLLWGPAFRLRRHIGSIQMLLDGLILLVGDGNGEGCDTVERKGRDGLGVASDGEDAKDERKGARFDGRVTPSGSLLIGISG